MFCCREATAAPQTLSTEALLALTRSLSLLVFSLTLSPVMQSLHLVIRTLVNEPDLLSSDWLLTEQSRPISEHK